MTIYETGAIGRPWFGVSLGIGLGISLSFLEDSSFAERLDRLSFTLALFAKTTTYVLVVTAIIVFVGLIFGTMTINSATSESQLLDNPDFLLFLGMTLSLFAIIIFFLQLDRLLGPGVLIKLLLGRYHRPRREHRVFMFLDITSSTSIVERLSKEDYYSFVNDFFRDLSTPVLNAGGEIYQYIGYEVVISWKHEVGTRDAICLRVFFAIDAAIEGRKKYYLDRCGIVPEYKAGAHLGEVITAQIGDLKKEFVYNGDVLNTAARIQSKCNELGRRFVTSKQLIQAVEVPKDFSIEELGAVALRGKAEPIELVGLA
ncbi:MAG: adenylate cyclase [Saprospiraceae bacterium]|jgi:adenylate cyclase